MTRSQLNTMIRSIQKLKGHPVKATDGNVGKVKDFLFDDREWGLLYLVVDTVGWLSSRKVLVNTGGWLSGQTALLKIEWIERFEWSESTVSVDLTTEQIEMAPAFDPEIPINRNYLQQLCDYYGRPYNS